MKTTKIKTAVAVAFAAVAIFAQSAPAAGAGTYHVYQCNSNTGYANDGWTWGGDAWAYGVSGCTNAFRLTATGLGAGRDEYWQTPTLPGDLKFSGVSFMSASSTGGGSTLLSAGFCTAGTVWYGECTVSDGTSITDGTIQYGIACRSWYYECNLAQFRISTGDGSKRMANGNFFFYNLDFTVNDPTAPFAWQPHNGTLRNDNSTNPWTDGNYWNAGTKNTGVYGVDNSESGVKQTRLFFDGDPNNGQVAQVFDKSCNYATWVPCPIFVGDTATVNTLAFSDGPHTATTRAIDAADNTTDATTNFKVDNTKPDRPMSLNATSSVANGWQTTNGFNLAWTNGAEVAETTTKSGIAQVKVDVEPTDAASQTNPAAVVVPVGAAASGISATVNSVTGVTVPAKGQWSVVVSLIDKAGNESAVGAGGPSTVSIGWDDAPPAAPSGRLNGWVSRDELTNGYRQEWSLTRTINELAPICGFATSITAVQSDPGTSINVVGDVRSMQLPANLNEGDHVVNLRSVTCAGLASPQTEHVQAPVDLTDPTGQITGVEDDQWYKDNQVVSISGSDALSGMAPSNDNVTAHGAYLAYTMNIGSETLIPGDRGTFTITGEGVKELSFSPVDLAGNRAKPEIVRFGIDATAPSGTFAATDANRPTLLSAPVSDVTSGIELATIEVRNVSGGDWITLPTSIADASGQAVAGYPKNADVSARFPDTQLPRGTYAVRLRGDDRAGNELVTTKRADGSEMTVTNPMRGGVAFSAGLSKAVRTCKKLRTSKGKKRGKKSQRNGTCFKHYRGKVVFTGTSASLSVGFKRGAVVQGVLTDTSYHALAHQPIEVYATCKGEKEELLGNTSTKSDGSYVFKVKPGMSRTIRVYFPGTEKIEDASATVQLGTAAKISLKLSMHHAFTGQTVKFSGKVRSFDGSIPAAGKIVVLQFYAAKKWRPAVAVAHTDSQGRFSVNYKFDGARVKNRIVFRVFAPTEDGWGHAASASKRATMRLN